MSVTYEARKFRRYRYNKQDKFLLQSVIEIYITRYGCRDMQTIYERRRKKRKKRRKKYMELKSTLTRK